MKITVIFDLWGQRCETVFDENSELNYMEWIRTITDKGYAYTVEVRNEDNVVLWKEDDIQRRLRE